MLGGKFCALQHLQTRITIILRRVMQLGSSGTCSSAVKADVASDG